MIAVLCLNILLEKTDIDVPHGTIVESLEEPGHRLGDGGLEVLDELVGVLIEELVHGLGQLVGLAIEQVVHLDVEAADVDCDVGILVNDDPVVSDVELRLPCHSGVAELCDVGSGIVCLELQDGDLSLDDVLAHRLGGGAEHAHLDSPGVLVSLDVEKLMLRQSGNLIVSELDVNIDDGILQVEGDLVQDEGVGPGDAELGNPGLHVGLDRHGQVSQAGVQVPTTAGALLQVFLDFRNLTWQNYFKINNESLIIHFNRSSCMTKIMKLYFFQQSIHRRIGLYSLNFYSSLKNIICISKSDFLTIITN